MHNKDITNFLFELGHLRRIKHEGWRLTGVDVPDSVAEHTCRAAQIGYVLAKMENYENPFEVASIVLFHDMPECRIGDLHKMASRYVDAREDEAVKDQTQKLGDMGKEIFSLWENFELRKTKAGIIAKDADLLEQAFYAKEMLETGHKAVQDWITNIEKRIKTDSAKRLLAELQKTDPYGWWHGLKKIPSD